MGQFGVLNQCGDYSDILNFSNHFTYKFRIYFCVSVLLLLWTAFSLLEASLQVCSTMLLGRFPHTSAAQPFWEFPSLLCWLSILFFFSVLIFSWILYLPLYSYFPFLRMSHSSIASYNLVHRLYFRDFEA